jgi:carbon-monoxide dehydrogenase medium subunit
LTGVAVVIAADAVRVGITGVAPVAYRATGVESALAGRALSDQLIALAASHATDGIEPLGDIHASPDFRRHLAEVNTRRAITRAAGR